MKIQNLAVIFVIIALPILLVLTYYITIQSNTLRKQEEYNSKLLDSTKEAIDAFEINTVEWNSEYSSTADSKRRDVMASINTFTNSFANNLGISGTTKESILSYVPAIAFTLYDGYYIYSPSQTYKTIKDSDGLTVLMSEELCNEDDSLIFAYRYKAEDEGSILYLCDSDEESDGEYSDLKFTLDSTKAQQEYTHILKPLSSYLKTYKANIGGNNAEVAVNYTLDNYIKVYGKIEKKEEEDGTETYEYVSRAGYLTAKDKIEGINTGTISGIEFNGVEIKPEQLTENVVYKEEGVNEEHKNVNYVYAMDKIKVYIDSENNAFTIDSKNNKILIKDLSENNIYYKRVVVPRNVGGWSYIELFQDLGTGIWYKKADYNIDFSASNRIKIDLTSYTGVQSDIECDYSAINYCVESFVFSEWFRGLATSYDVIDGINPKDIFISDPEDPDSLFNEERKKVIRSTLESNLNQAITSYSRQTDLGDFYMPQLTESDWEQIYKNASIITFVQNIPIGTKNYNNYAIATSTLNKECVDPNEIYLQSDNDTYYHRTYYENGERTYCNHIEDGNIIGYRNIDYVLKTYETKDEITGDNKINYYFKHSTNTTTNTTTNTSKVSEECYYCIIQRELHTKTENTKQNIAYYTALARERYAARTTRLPNQVEPSYWINILAVDEDTGSIVSGTKFKINDVLVETNQYREKINKEEVPTTYSISAETSEDIVTATEIQNYNKVSIDNSYSNVGKSSYSSDSYINFIVSSYDDSGVTIDNISGASVECGLSKDGSNISSDKLESTLKMDSADGNGNFVARLKYKKNYEVDVDNKKVESYANINNENKLTIVSKIEGITGIIRLKYTNEKDNKTYVTNPYKINENIIVQCEITGKEWYVKDWKVSVIANDGKVIADGDSTKFYTIKNNEGLAGFAKAVNEGSKTASRNFYVINDIGVSETEIQMDPIAANGEFNGIFEGAEINETTLEITFKARAIYGVKIGYEESAALEVISKKYKYFGLFGKTGINASIKNINLYNENIDITTINTESMKYNENQEYKTGGIVGENNGIVENVNVYNSTIIGTAYVGGIVGESTKNLMGLEVKSTYVKTAGKYTYYYGKDGGEQDNQIYVGGIVGKLSENSKISKCIIDKCIIGKIDENFKWKFLFEYDGNYNAESTCYIKSKNRIIIGGIVGYYYDKNDDIGFNENSINNSIIGTDSVSYSFEKKNINAKISNGDSIWDSNSGAYIGSYIGFYETDINKTIRDITLENNKVNGASLKISEGEENFSATTSNTYRNGTGGFAGYSKGLSFENVSNNNLIISYRK